MTRHFRVAEIDCLEIAGAQHRLLASDRSGLIWARLEDSSICLSFTNEEFIQLLSSPDVRLKRGEFSDQAAFRRLRCDITYLQTLPPDKCSKILWQTACANAFLEAEARAETTRSDQAVQKILPILEDRVNRAEESGQDVGRSKRAGHVFARRRFPSARWLLQWVRMYEAGGCSPLVFVRKRRPDLSVRRLIRETESILAECVAGYLDRNEPTQEQIVQDTHDRFAEVNAGRVAAGMVPLPKPSARTVRRRIDALDPFEVIAQRNPCQCVEALVGRAGCDAASGRKPPSRGVRHSPYSPEVAARCFAQIEGFADYGFPESHAAAFALLVYVSAWLKRHHPAVFACALLNAQPMGFYAPAQIVRDARDHRVEVRPVCVNASLWDNSLERQHGGGLALRLGFRQIKGLKKDDADWIAAARGNGYPDPQAIWLRAGIAPAVLERLAEADAFSGMRLTRREALWQVRAIHGQAPLPLFSDPIDGEAITEPPVTLPAMHIGEEVVEDYVATRLSLRAHPMALLRPNLPGLTRHDALRTAPLRRTTVCGLVITRQRPGTASGVVFLTLEDETGVSNIVVWRKVFERFRRAVMGGRLLRVTGRLQREGIVTHLIAEGIEDVSHLLGALGHPLSDAVARTTAQTDNAPRSRPAPRAHHPREQAKRLFPSRDFH